jgi:hypothetical protein
MSDQGKGVGGFRLDILGEAVKWAQNLDDVAAKLTIRLDDKAQQTGAMAGIFLAAAFGFLKPETIALIGPHKWAARIFSFAIATFLVCLGTCLSVTWLRLSPVPLSLETLNELNEDVLQLPDDLISESVQQNYYRDRLEVWSEILRTRGRLNKGKAARLKIAQALLALGMTTVAFLLFGMIRTILR